MLPSGLPRTITWQPVSELGLSRMGFIRTSGSSRQAWACTTWARPISRPSPVTNELSDMFWALKGAAWKPSWSRIRQKGGRQQALARVGRRPLEHQGRGRVAGTRRVPSAASSALGGRHTACACYDRGRHTACACYDLRQRVAQRRVLLGGPHGDAEESAVEVLAGSEGADGDPPAQEPLGQGEGVQVRPVDPHQEEIGRARIDVESPRGGPARRPARDAGRRRSGPSGRRSRPRPARPGPPPGPAS